MNKPLILSPHFVTATLLAALSVGCSTSAIKSEKSSPPSVSQKRMNEEAMVFVKKTVAAPLEDASKSSAGECKKNSTLFAKLDPTAQLKLAKTCAESKDWVTIENMGQELLVQNAANPWGPYFLGLAAQSRGNINRALWMNELAAKKAGSPVALIVYQRGRIALEQNDLNAAFLHFDEAAKLDPMLFEAQGYVAFTLYNEGDFKASIPYFEAFFRSKKLNQPEPYSAYATALTESGKPEVARAVLEKGMDLVPYDARLRFQHADLLETKLNDKKEALEAYVDIRNLITKGKLKDAPKIALADKIKALEAQVQSMNRVPAQTDTQKKKGEGV